MSKYSPLEFVTSSVKREYEGEKKRGLTVIQQNDLEIIRAPTARLSRSNEGVPPVGITVEEARNVQHATEDLLQLLGDLIAVDMVRSEVV